MNTFLISDHHYGHANILKFTDSKTGQLVRPGFADVDEMNEHMIEEHNKVVGPRDKVYFGGDIAFSSNVFHTILPRLNGRKTLIWGNHDKLKLAEYEMYFDSFYAYRHFKLDDKRRFVLSHCPLHPGQNAPAPRLVNVHGHIHQNVIDDPYYFNICVEPLNYVPIEIEDMWKRIQDNIDKQSDK